MKPVLADAFLQRMVIFLSLKLYESWCFIKLAIMHNSKKHGPVSPERMIHHTDTAWAAVKDNALEVQSFLLFLEDSALRVLDTHESILLQTK